MYIYLYIDVAFVFNGTSRNTKNYINYYRKM